MGGAAASGSMAQALLVVTLFVAAMALLPWLLRRLKQRQSALSGNGAVAARVLTAISLGPQQRLVTVEVGSGDARTCLVLGVTAQQITCLHVLPVPPAAPGAAAVAAASDAAFSQAMAAAQARPSGAANHG